MVGRKNNPHLDVEDFWEMKGIKVPSGYNYQKHYYQNSRRKRSSDDNQIKDDSFTGANFFADYFEKLISQAFQEEVASAFLDRTRSISLLKDWERLLKVYINLCRQINDNIIKYSTTKKQNNFAKFKSNIMTFVIEAHSICEEISDLMNSIDLSMNNQFSKILNWLALGDTWSAENDLENIYHNGRNNFQERFRND